MFYFELCEDLPEGGGRGVMFAGGGLVEVEGRVVWGRGTKGQMYSLEEDRWIRWTSDVELEATLGVCGGSLVAVGGEMDDVWIKEVMVWRGGRWSHMSDMLVGCTRSCVVSVGGGGLVVMGGWGDGPDDSKLAAVQVFDGKTQTWHFGPPLPKPCRNMSAVVHENQLFLMGGTLMETAVWCANINDLIAVQSQDDTQQSIWRELPDVPYIFSAVCVVDGVLLAIGGRDGSDTSQSAIYAFHPVDQKWQHVGDMPFECFYVDTLLLSDGRLLVVDGLRHIVLRVTVEGLAMVFPSPLNAVMTDDRRLYEEAMTKGYVETSVTKCLILGAAGAGKTHLKHLLLKKDHPKQRVSTGLADNPARAISFTPTGVGRQEEDDWLVLEDTGLADNPVRAISFTLAGVGGQEEDDWFVVEDDQALMSVIGGIIKGGVSKAPSLADVVSTLPKMAIDPSNVPSDGAVGPTPAGVNITKDTTQPEQSRTVNIENELVHHINQSSDNKKLFGVKWIQFIDSGGQLQYHDILPLFIQNPMVTIFVLKLSEELSHHPTIEYYGADGKPVGKSYRSSLSHKQILQHCLGAIHSQDAHPLIIVVGTHRDALRGKFWKESIEEKNKQLKALLDSTHSTVLYCGEGMNELIFAVNGLSPEDVDRHVAQVLKKQIISKSPQQLIKMPLAWFGLEVVLQRSSHDGVLSLVECRVSAERFHMEEDAFSAALHHLVKHNVFLYYPEVLPQTVFCDPQVVLTKVTELVQYHHKLRNNPDKRVAVGGDLVMFRDHGLLSVELLKTFPKHYKEGLFTPQDLLELLVSRGAIAMIRDGEYLMPALLPHLDSTQVSKYLERGASLMIRFTYGYIPSGLFCCLVAHLLSSSWKVCMDGNRPLRLYRNCITLIQRNTPEIVTLVDMFSYIAVHVNEASSEVCKEIRGIVHSGIKSACSGLKYSHVQFEDAFMCAGARCTSDPPHVAVVVWSKSAYKWRCTILEDQNGDLSEDQLMWSPGTRSSEPTMEDLMNDVAAVVPAKWRFVGIQLKVPQRDLEDIQSQMDGRPNCCLYAFEVMLAKWSTLNPHLYTWSTIIGALETPCVGEVALAAKLRTKYLC